VVVQDDQAQAGYVIEQVLTARERGVDLRRQAVLFRAADHSDLLELELMRRNIPFVKYGGLKFLEAAHVKDLLAVLRLADNPRNRIAAFRVLQLLPGMGPANSARVCDAFESAGYRFDALSQLPVPAAAREAWSALSALLVAIGGTATPLGWADHAGAELVRTPARSALRARGRPPRGSRAARADRSAVRDARGVRDRADARSAAGDR
jgi:DNA helicase-2/ATP-dependent DNA helicase PcrA